MMTTKPPGWPTSYPTNPKERNMNTRPANPQDPEVRHAKARQPTLGK